MTIKAEVVDMSNVELVGEFVGKKVSGAIEDDSGLKILFTDGSKLIINAGFDERDLPTLRIESDLVGEVDDGSPMLLVDHDTRPE